MAKTKKQNENEERIRNYEIFKEREISRKAREKAEKKAQKKYGKLW